MPMSGKKHVFKMVPGKEVLKDQIRHNIDWSRTHRTSVKKVELVPLDDKNDVVLNLPAKFCGDLCKDRFICIEENEEGLASKAEHDSSSDYVNNKHALVYYGNTLVKLSIATEFVQGIVVSGCRSTVGSERLKYQYVTWEESDTGNNKYYFSDKEGNIIDSPDNEALQDIMLYCGERQMIRDIVLPNIPESILLSNAFAKIFAEDLTENQLKTFANTLSNEQLQVLAQNLTDNQLQKIIPELNSNQLQALAENLTDEQLQALVDHLTNHQLQTLAQELNPEKLQIIVPILNDAQLEALVRDLNPEQVKEILPHLKVDQFKALIKTLNDEQFTVLAKDLAEHHLTILSKELEGDQLKALVNSLQEDQLKDLVNKLDHEKLEAIAQDLTDSDRIQIIIKSLVNNPEKLQAFARNMSNEQFKELLDNVGAEELKDIIHKLPYEKVTAVIGDLSNQDQSKAVIDALKETLEKQSELINGMREELKEFITPPPMDSSHIIEEYYGFGLV
ncbi:mgtE_N domain-containing protein [Trichonephila clavata]|uniref:MgtE_N domain-containing protein n=1 Tax=Trichonephila clavata TaxID=2740835 RepID=A0A8X6H8M4_TRICU|nr:mgtE_N domain-containing protein [Trichonephila clavata]